MRVLDADVEAIVPVKDLHVFGDELAVGIEELHIDIRALAHLDVDLQGGILVIVVQKGVNVVVDWVELGESVEVDISEDAAEPPLVLILEVGAITSLIDLDGKKIVLANLDKVRDVEFAWVTSSLRVADFLAIDPDGKGRVDALEAQSQLVVRKVVTNFEGRHMSAAFIVIVGDVGRINGPGEVEIGVLRTFAVALALPHTGHDNVVPF